MSKKNPGQKNIDNKQANEINSNDDEEILKITSLR